MYTDFVLPISDIPTERGSHSAGENLVNQLLSKGSLTVKPNGYLNLSTNPVYVEISYNVVQILGFVSVAYC